MAVFVTSSIANSKVWETGWESMRLGIAAFLIPFAFVFNDGLLLQGDLEHIVLAVATAMVGAILLAASARGYLFRNLNPLQRLVVFASGLLFIASGVILPLVGAALTALAYSVPFLRWRVARSV